MIQSQPTMQAKDKRLKNFNEVSLGYSKRTATEEARRCPQCAQPSCRQGCPLHIDIPLFIRFIREGDYCAAYNKIKEQNPWPGICGRVCSAPCEKACTLNQEGAPIGIRALERFADDHGRKKSLFPKQEFPKKGKRIAVIGSGAAGLTAAHGLAKDYTVAVFEALPYLGGALFYGIPEFRLPKKILDQGISDLKTMGISFKTNYALGAILKVQDFFAQDFAAIVLCPGRGGVLRCDMPGIYAAGVLFAEELLLSANLSRKNLFPKEMSDKIGENVVVLGSDFAALDAARILRRLAKKVSVVFPGTEEDLDVSFQEREQARQEGVVLKPLTEPVEILGNDSDDVVGIKCLNMDFADPGGKGSWKLLPVPESDFVLEADSVIIRIRTGIKDPEIYSRIIPYMKLKNDGSVWTDPLTGMTSVKNVFAAGRAVCDRMTLTEAVADGKRVAGHVLQYLQKGKKDA